MINLDRIERPTSQSSTKGRFSKTAILKLGG